MLDQLGGGNQYKFLTEFQDLFLKHRLTILHNIKMGTWKEGTTRIQDLPEGTTGAQRLMRQGLTS